MVWVVNFNITTGHKPAYDNIYYFYIYFTTGIYERSIYCQYIVHFPI